MMKEKGLSIGVVITMIISILLACGGWAYGVIQSGYKTEIETFKTRVIKVEDCQALDKSQIEVLKNEVGHISASLQKIENKMDFVISNIVKNQGVGGNN